MFFLNEHIVHYEGCDVGLCSWSYLKQKLAPIIDPSTCNNNFCFRSSAYNLNNNYFNVILVSLCIVLNFNTLNL